MPTTAPIIPLDTSVQAEYEDGFILDETTQKDQSIFNEGQNTFFDILDRIIEQQHGRMVRFSVFWKGMRYDFDWTRLPDNARPIRFRRGYFTRYPDGSTERGWRWVRFGYQYNDANGKNIQKVQQLD